MELIISLGLLTAMWAAIGYKYRPRHEKNEKFRGPRVRHKK